MEAAASLKELLPRDVAFKYHVQAGCALNQILDCVGDKRSWRERGRAPQEDEALIGVIALMTRLERELRQAQAVNAQAGELHRQELESRSSHKASLQKTPSFSNVRSGARHRKRLRSSFSRRRGRYSDDGMSAHLADIDEYVDEDEDGERTLRHPVGEKRGDGV